MYDSARRGHRFDAEAFFELFEPDVPSTGERLVDARGTRPFTVQTHLGARAGRKGPFSGVGCGMAERRLPGVAFPDTETVERDGEVVDSNTGLAGDLLDVRICDRW